MDDLTARLVAALLVALRVAPALAYGGPFTLLRVPLTMRVLLALVLALWLVAGRPAATVDVVRSGASLLSLAAGELLVGIAIALCLQLAFAAILWAGRAVDIQAGFGLAMVADPTTQAQMPLAGTVFAYGAAAVFFTMGGAHDLIALWAASLDALPMGHGLLAGDMQALSALAGTLFAMGIGLVAIVMLVLFLLDLTIAFMSRTLPQMNVLLLGFQVKSMATLLTLPVALAVSAGIFVRLLRTALEGAPGLLGQGTG
ncbi:MAG: flagellar biosynthetic protein FliR [Novosphingobium sp.]|nr:flagellar biosynthetic protein FliR [Novosphingobium sp.]